MWMSEKLKIAILTKIREHKNVLVGECDSKEMRQQRKVIWREIHKFAILNGYRPQSNWTWSYLRDTWWSANLRRPTLRKRGLLIQSGVRFGPEQFSEIEILVLDILGLSTSSDGHSAQSVSNVGGPAPPSVDRASGLSLSEHIRTSLSGIEQPAATTNADADANSSSRETAAIETTFEESNSSQNQVSGFTEPVISSVKPLSLEHTPPETNNNNASLVCWCGRKAQTASELAVHKRFHGKYRPFACKWCHYRAHQVSTLRAHVANRHTGCGKGKYVCEGCGRAYKHVQPLLLHREQCRGEDNRIQRSEHHDHIDPVKTGNPLPSVYDDRWASFVVDEDRNGGVMMDHPEYNQVAFSPDTSSPVFAPSTFQRDKSNVQCRMSGGARSAMPTGSLIGVYKHSVFGEAVAQQMETFDEEQCREVKFRIQQALYEVGKKRTTRTNTDDPITLALSNHLNNSNLVNVNPNNGTMQHFG